MILKKEGSSAVGRYRERFSTSIDPKLINGLRKLSDNTRIPMSKLLDEAIEDLLIKYNYQATTEP